MGQACNTVNPKHLDLNQYPIHSPQIALTTPTFKEDWDDDLAIANGQVGFDDEGSGLDIYGWSGHNGQENPADKLDWVSNIGFGSVQANSAPPNAWGNGSFGGDLRMGEEGPSLVTDSEPWNHLKQKFAFLVSEPDQASSWDYQNEATPQTVSNLLIPGTPQSPSCASRRPQNFAADHSAPYDLHYAHTAYTPYTRTASPKVTYTPLYTPQQASLQQLRRRDSDWCPQGRHRSSTSSTSSSTPFPDLEIDQSPSKSWNSKGSIIRPHHCRKEAGPVQTGISSDTMKENFGGTPQDTMEEPRRNSQIDNAFPNAYGGVDQYTSPFESAENIDPNSEAVTKLTTGQDPPSRHSTLPSGTIYGLECGDAGYYGPSNGSNQLDHPHAIRVPHQAPSSQRHQSGRPSSFPTTAGCFPPTISKSFADPPPPTQKIRRRRQTISMPNTYSIPMRRKTSNNKSNRTSRSDSLSIIQEDGRRALVKSPTGSLKGRRYKPLSQEAKDGAKQKRNDKSVCLRCRMMKQSCKGPIPCDGCRENSRAKLWVQPCTKADFLDMIKYGTCNYIFEHYISQEGHNRSRRYTMHYPGNFDVPRLINCLQSCQDKCNIEVRQWLGFSYTMDLARCLKVFLNAQNTNQPGSIELDDLVHNKSTKTSDWLACLKDYDPSTGVLSQSIKCNTMPSGNTYRLLPLSPHVSSRTLNFQDRNDRAWILFAINLSRIILRALEVEAFQSLQKELNELPKGTKSGVDIDFLVEQLGQILLSLRRRLSWWAVVGTHLRLRDDRFTAKVEQLTKVLYFYFFVAKKRSSSRETLSTKVVYTYADVDAVEESFPEVDTIEGYHDWLLSGQDLIRAARVQQYLSRW